MGTPPSRLTMRSSTIPRKCLSVYRTFTVTAWPQMLPGPPLTLWVAPGRVPPLPLGLLAAFCRGMLRGPGHALYPAPALSAQSSSARVHPQGVPSHTCTVNMLWGPCHHSPAQSLGVSLKLSPREPPAAVDKGPSSSRVGVPQPAPHTPPSDLLTLGQCFVEEAAPGTLYTASPPSDSPSDGVFIMVLLSR